MKTFARTFLLTTTTTTLAFGCALDGVEAESDLDETEVRELGGDAFLLSLPCTMTVAEAPSELRRRAASQLEAMRSAKEGNPNVRFSGLVYIYDRPDVDGPAYYEFEFSDGEQVSGSIMVSTGYHDFPVNLQSSEGNSVGRGLIDEALAADTTPVRLFKLDTFSYVAETDEGTIGAQLGNLPRRVVGAQMWMLDEPVPAGQEISFNANDDAPGEPEVVLNGEQGSPLNFEDFADWDSLVAEYASALAVDLEALRRDADRSWFVEESVQANGEGIAIGEPARVPLLAEDTQFSIEGPGAGIVEGVVWPGQNGPVLEISAIDLPAEPTSFTVHIDHAELEDEILTYFVSAQVDEPAPNAEPVFYSSWSPWRIYWAAGSAEQRLYGQHQRNGCPVGCGPVAWGMLFGWADNRADQGNSYWAPRWGIYRENGGYGNDVAAPRNPDAGVRNMIDEIAQHVGTFCIFGQGATMHWDMHNAYKYLQGRTGTRLKVDYNFFSVSEDRLRDMVINRLQRDANERTPVVIGTGFISTGHYPLAWAYAERTHRFQSCGWFSCSEETELERAFYLNQGWGGRMDWAPARTWFAGQIFPE